MLINTSYIPVGVTDLSDEVEQLLEKCKLLLLKKVII
jgi:hypothetical protein